MIFTEVIQNPVGVCFIKDTWTPYGIFRERKEYIIDQQEQEYILYQMNEELD